MNLKTILLHAKYTMLLRPSLKDNADFDNNTYVDTAGMSGVMLFLFLLGDTDVASGDAVGSGGEDVAPYLEQCDTTGGTYTAVTSAALSDSLQHDDDNKIFGIAVDLSKSHKRYMRVHEPHSADGTVGSCMGILAIGIPDIPPVNATQMGLEELVQV